MQRWPLRQVVSELLVDGGQRDAVRELRADYAAACDAMCDALRAAGGFEFRRPLARDSSPRRAQVCFRAR